VSANEISSKVGEHLTSFSSQRLHMFICTAVVDAPTGRVTLGASMANGIEQKGIDTLSQCIKKCSAAGLGIPATVSVVTERFILVTSVNYSPTK